MTVGTPSPFLMRNPQSKADAAPGTPLADPASRESGSVDQWVPLVYAELRALARRARRHERDDQAITTTALIHEAYLKLSTSRERTWGRSHFFAVASRAMRQVLVDLARSRNAAKRAPGLRALSLEESLVVDRRAEGLVELDEALERLAELSPRLVQVVEFRFFGGLSEAETATVLGVTSRTVRRDWVKAKGWLQQALTHEPEAGEPG